MNMKEESKPKYIRISDLRPKIPKAQRICPEFQSSRDLDNLLLEDDRVCKSIPNKIKKEQAKEEKGAAASEQLIAKTNKINATSKSLSSNIKEIKREDIKFMNYKTNIGKFNYFLLCLKSFGSF